MQTAPIAEARDRLDELVNEVVSTRGHVTITKNGAPAAVLVSADEWESLQETLFWLAQRGLAEDIASGRAEHERGDTLGEDEARSRCGIRGTVDKHATSI